jgi:UDP-N-acetylglucosamine 2-epimerase (non-hydrolysing)
MSLAHIMVVIGTRPEAVKMFPVIQRIRERGDVFRLTICSVGQHREMLAQMFALFGIEPDLELNIMTENQSLDDIVSRTLLRMGEVFRSFPPDFVLVQGDTSAAFAAALCAFHHGIPVGHVEAGLRTGDRGNPFPEEMNRRLISSVSRLHFAPTVRAESHLLSEGVSREDIFLTGNTVVDALLNVAATAEARKESLLCELALEKMMNETSRLVLVTAHRRENFGEPLANICRAIERLAGEFPDVGFVFSVHRNPEVVSTVRELLDGRHNILLSEPLSYDTFVLLMKMSYLILTDSGGIQEEAPTFGIPVLVMREKTERPEAVEAGTARIVGTAEESVRREVVRLLTDHAVYEQMARAHNPYGDGRAAERIVEILSRKYTGETRWHARSMSSSFSVG